MNTPRNGPTAALLDALEAWAGRAPAPYGNGWTTPCPACDGGHRTPCLTVADGDAGRVLAKCHKCGASAPAVADALGMPRRDLVPEHERHGPGPPVRIGAKRPLRRGPLRTAAPPPVTAAPDNPSAPKPVPGVWPPVPLTPEPPGFSTIRPPAGHTFGGAWLYRDEGGAPLWLRVRWNAAEPGAKRCSLHAPAPGCPTDGRGVPTVWQPSRGNARRVLYRLPAVARAVAEGVPVWIVEGEKCADALRAAFAADGVPDVVTTAGAVNEWRADFADVFEGMQAPVYLVPDNDAPGVDVAARAARDLAERAGVVARVVALPGLLHGQDVADWLAAPEDDGHGGSVAELLPLAEEAPPYSPHRGAESVAALPAKAFDPDALGFFTYDTITPRSLRWLWPGRIPAGALTVLDGREGTGKTFFLCDLVARVTRGRAFPDEPHGTPVEREAATVLFINSESPVDSELAARLKAAGADMSRVAGWPLPGKPSPRFPDDVGTLAAAVRHYRPALIVVDTLFNHFGEGYSFTSETDVRAVLVPLISVAMETGAAVLASRHFRKGGGDSAEAGTGAVAVRGLARASHALGIDPDANDPTATDAARIFAPSKNNGGAYAVPLAYVIDSATLPACVDENGLHVPPVEVGCVRWIGERSDVRADDLTAPGRATGSGRAMPQDAARTETPAVRWLRERMEDAPGVWMVAADVIAAAAEEGGKGLTAPRIYAAAKKLAEALPDRFQTRGGPGEGEPTAWMLQPGDGGERAALRVEPRPVGPRASTLPDERAGGDGDGHAEAVTERRANPAPLPHGVPAPVTNGLDASRTHAHAHALARARTQGGTEADGRTDGRTNTPERPRNAGFRPSAPVSVNASRADVRTQATPAPSPVREREPLDELAGLFTAPAVSPRRGDGVRLPPPVPTLHVQPDAFDVGDVVASPKWPGVRLLVVESDPRTVTVRAEAGGLLPGTVVEGVTRPASECHAWTEADARRGR